MSSISWRDFQGDGDKIIAGIACLAVRRLEATESVDEFRQALEEVIRSVWQYATEHQLFSTSLELNEFMLRFYQLGGAWAQCFDSGQSEVVAA